MRMHRSFISFVAVGVLALSAVVDTSSPTLTAQTVSTVSAVSPFAAQQRLRVRSHRLQASAARSHTGWEGGLWLRGPILTADHARRDDLVRFLRTELIPYITSERSVVYPVADIVLGPEGNLTSAAIADGHIIEGFLERLEAANRFADARSFQTEVTALSVVVDRYFATDHRVIERVLALGPGGTRGAWRSQDASRAGASSQVGEERSSPTFSLPHFRRTAT